MAWNEPGPGRDPWNQGGKRGDGPPDLDAMLKRLRARFGGKGGRTGAPLPMGVIGLALAALVVLWSLTGWYVVDEQERAVVLRLGKYMYTTEPGPHWRLPWPLERVEIVNVTGVRTSRDSATVLTRDTNIISVEMLVQYRVSKVEDFVFNVNDPDKTLQQATTSAVREVVGRSTMDEVLTGGREQVADDTKAVLQARLDEYQTGLVVTEVNLQRALPPEAVQAAFDDAIKASEDRQRLKNEAEAYSNDRLPRARGAAARQLAEATAYRDQVVARAEGDAARFTQLLAEYKKSPAVMRERLYLDTMNSVMSSNNKILVDVDKGAPLFYLPLNEMLKNAPRADALADPNAAAGAGARPSAPGATYDPSRSRERGR